MSYKMHILVCGGTGCRASASHQIITRLEECLKEKNLEDEVQVIATGCFGFCEKGPIVKIMPDNTFYVQVKPDDAEEIVNEHVIKGRKVERLLYKDPEKKEAVSGCTGKCDNCPNYAESYFCGFATPYCKLQGKEITHNVY